MWQGREGRKCMPFCQWIVHLSHHMFFWRSYAPIGNFELVLAQNMQKIYSSPMAFHICCTSPLWNWADCCAQYFHSRFHVYWCVVLFCRLGVAGNPALVWNAPLRNAPRAVTRVSRFKVSWPGRSPRSLAIDDLGQSELTGSVCEQLLRLLGVENLFCKIPFYDPPQIPLKHTMYLRQYMQMRQLMQMRLSFSLTSTEQIWERYSRCGCMLAPLQDCAT
jgi:hypothetical protein